MDDYINTVSGLRRKSDMRGVSFSLGPVRILLSSGNAGLGGAASVRFMVSSSKFAV